MQTKRRINIEFLFFIIFAVSTIFASCSKEQNVIKVGAILPLTGPVAKYGQNSKHAIEMAIEKININSKIRFQVIFEDDAAEAKNSVSALNKLTTIDHVMAIIGPLPSSNTLAVASEANRRKTVLISPGATSPKISEAGPFIFRNCSSDDYEGKKMAEFAINTLGFRKFSVLYINNDYGIDLQRIFKQSIEAFHGEVITSQSFTPNASDFRAQLIKIKATETEAIYIIALNEYIPIARQLKQLGVSGQILGTIMMNNKDIITKASGALDGAICTAWQFDLKDAKGQTKLFIDQFIEKYGVEPDTFAAQSYDCMLTIASALKNIDYEIDTDKFRQSMLLTETDGVTGLTRFDKNGDAIKPLRFQKVKGLNFIIFH